MLGRIVTLCMLTVGSYAMLLLAWYMSKLHPGRSEGCARVLHGRVSAVTYRYLAVTFSPALHSRWRVADGPGSVVAGGRCALCGGLVNVPLPTLWLTILRTHAWEPVIA